MLTKSSEKIPKYTCELCHIETNNKKDYNKHLATRKHQNNLSLTTINIQLPEPVSLHTCSVCNKNYKSRVGLWYHQKKCIPKSEDNNSIVNRLLDENKELRNFIIEQSRVLTEHQKETSDIINKVVELTKTPNTVINQTTNNNNNQRFNINVFLNETCKDAINFSDFVKNIQISYEDLENNAQLGFVNGISKIFLDNLKQLDVNERPIHCTDVKRETMYIKDENEWTKQSDDDKLQKAIQTVSYRSMGKLAEWKNENPDYKDCNSEFSQKCLDIQRQTLAGSDRGVYYPKVIHALAREVVVEK
jgi:hypothetical protein